MKDSRIRYHMIVTGAVLILLLTAECNNINPVSPGPQPVILEETRHTPLLDVFGVLRPDTVEGMPLSYVHLEFSYPADDIPDSSIVADGFVTVIRESGDASFDSLLLVYTGFNIFPKAEYRHAALFPERGTYRLICRKEGFPVLTARTVMPGVPVVPEDSIRVRDGWLDFVIERDEEAALYEVVLENGRLVIRDRFIRPESGNTAVSLSVKNLPGGSCRLTVFAFDLNMSRYLTANLSIKPNIYQKDFSTVENGYGCFGSLNIYKKCIDL